MPHRAVSVKASSATGQATAKRTPAKCTVKAKVTFENVAQSADANESVPSARIRTPCTKKSVAVGSVETKKSSSKCTAVSNDSEEETITEVVNDTTGIPMHRAAKLMADFPMFDGTTSVRDFLREVEKRARLFGFDKSNCCRPSYFVCKERLTNEFKAGISGLLRRSASIS